MILSIIIMILAIIGYTLLFWFGVPFIIPPDAVPWVYFISFTIVNVIALILSWVYFDRTHCYEDEGNPIAMAFYYLVGHDVTHFFLFLIRLFSNIGFYFTVFGLHMDLFGTMIHLSPQDNIFLSIPIAIFATELSFNIYAIVNHWEEKCKPVQPLFCPCLDKPNCYCDVSQIKD